MELNKFTFLTIFSVIYIIALIIIYYSKQRLQSKEIKIYKMVLFANLIGLILQSLCRVVSDNIDTLNRVLVDFVLKSFLVYFIAFGALLLIYIISIGVKNEKIVRNISFVYGILSIFVYVLPISVHIGETTDSVYSYGMASNYTYIVGGITSLLLIVMLVIEMKKVSKKKLLPLLLYLIFSGIAIVIQRLNPELMLICYVETFLCFVMYFTIENPDLKMLNELYKNRELMEQGYEDKYNFLFEMTQDAKKPLLDLNRVSNELRQEDDPKKIKEGLMAINNLTRQLDFAINDVLNVSSFDIQKLKIVNTKYDVLKVCDGLNTTMKGEIKKGVTFNMDLPKSVPTLYGDYMKLRQILYSLLNNASKNTDEGSINLRLNVIEKYDFCRLIFNISDTGKGMSIEKINDILSATGELDKNELELLEKKEFNFKVCQKVVKIMGGNIMIKSTVGMGTEITLTMDQRVYHEKETSVLNQYENAINTSKKVLIVAQDKDLSNYIKRKLNNNDISYSSLAFGGDAVDRIKAGKEYDYMLVQDDMKEMSGLATLQELKKLDNFEIPVIVMLNSSKDSIKDHYIKDGFTDYLLTDNVEEEIKRIIDKY